MSPRTWRTCRGSCSRARAGVRAHLGRGGLGAGPGALERPSRRAPRRCSWATPAIPLAPCWRPSGAARIADIAARHDLLVISDEIYDRLVYGGHRHEAFSALPDMRDRTILLGGFSKAYAMTGWRVGYACAPATCSRASSRSPVPDHVGSDDRSGRRPGGAHRGRAGCPADGRRYDRRRQMFVAGLNRIGLPTVEPRARSTRSPHQWHGLTSEQFSERLLFDHQVAVVPGSAFGRRARVSCEPAWPPATRASRRRSDASSGSSGPWGEPPGAVHAQSGSVSPFANVATSIDRSAVLTADEPIWMGLHRLFIDRIDRSAVRMEEETRLRSARLTLVRRSDRSAVIGKHHSW